MKLIKKFNSGRYHSTFLVELDSGLAVAKYQKPLTWVTYNFDIIYGLFNFGDQRRFAGPKERQRFETEKLKRLSDKEIPVPSVITRHENYFLMNYIPGELLSEISPEHYFGSLEKAVFTLSELHGKGEYHGAPNLANMIDNTGKIFMIDFETNLNHISLLAAQQRDLEILLRHAQRKMGAEIVHDAFYSVYGRFAKP